MNGNGLYATVSRGAAFLLAAVLLSAFAATSSLAQGKVPGTMDAKVTFNNKTDRDIFVALCWCAGEKATRGADGSLSVQGPRWLKGWYKIEPGKSRVITLANVLYDASDFGFYAQSSAPKGQKKYIWQGGKGNTLGVKTFVHPTESFSTTSCDVMKGGKLAAFRSITMKEKGGILVGSVSLSVSKK